MSLVHPVSIDLLEEWLKDAAHDVSADKDGDLYVSAETSEFPYWIRIKENPELIVFTSYIGTKATATDAQLGAICNVCNEKLTLPTFYYVTDDMKLYLYGQYVMTFSEGLNRSQFLKMSRRFSSEFIYGLRTFDPDGVLGSGQSD